MVSFRDAPPNAPRVALRIEEDVECPDCGYNLRGLRMDGRCPECGRPTIDTFARPLRAATGVLAEEMLRRPGGLLVQLLAWWIIWSSASAAPPVLGQAIQLTGAALIGMLLLLSLAQMAKLLRAARSRRGGSSKPLRDSAPFWWTLAVLSVALCGAHMGLALFWQGELEPVFWTILMLGACASAGGAQLLAAKGALTVLKRLALAAPAQYLPVQAVGLVSLIIIGLAPLAGGAMVALRVIVGLLALVVWGFATYQIVNGLREAQGSVVSIGRHARR